MSIKQAIEALEIAQDALDISQSLQESAKSNHHPKTLAAYERVSAALAALRSMPESVQVPKRPTQAMRDVMDSEGWAWEDLLAAAEAITEDEHAILATPHTEAVRMSEAEYVPCPTCAKNTASDDPSQWCPCAPRENKIRLQQKAMSDLTKLAQLAEQHALSYASPHHFTLSVVGLRSIIEAEFARAVEQATAARLGVKMGDAP